MVTINQQRKFFNDFADNHYQLKDFGWGDVADVSQEEATTYPLLWVNPSPWTVDENEISFKYTVFCADRTYDGANSQVTEVHSDTAQILLDLMASMDQQQDYDWELTKQATVTPFTDVWKDKVAGHFIDITFKVLFNYDECQIPTSGQPAPPPSSCEGAVITINTILYGSVASGGSEDIEVRNVAGDLVGSLINGVWVVPNAIACADATAVLKDTAGTTISTTSIASGATQNITAPNATAVIKDSANNTLKTEAILSNASENITINDSVAVLKNSLNTTILTENIRAEATENIPIADVDYTDSDGSPASVPYGTSLVCTPSASPSGVSLQWPNGNQYTSYRSGDEGSRVQASYFNYTRPAYPAVTAELDYTLGANYFWRLKTALRVGGTLNTLRFVDVDGVQAFGSTDNKNKIVIDKLTGIGFYRVLNDLGGQMTWNNAIDGALTFSVVVEGVTYSDWYLVSLEELTMLTGHEWAKDGALNLEDPITNIDLVLYSGFEEVWTSTTQANSTGNAYTKGWNGSTFVRGVSKAISGLAIPFIVFNAKSLISA